MTVIATILLSFAIFVAVVLAMSVGVLAGRPTIKGSCGGVGSEGCELCGSESRSRSGAGAGRAEPEVIR